MRFIKSEYFSNILSQAFLVIVAQLVPLLFSPLISRIYDEKAIAEITGMISFGSIMLVFSTLKLENVIVLEKRDNIAKQIVVFTVLLSFIYFILISILILIFKNYIVDTFKIDTVVEYVPLYILLYSLLNVLNHWLVRCKVFYLKGFSKIIENSSYVLISLLAYFVIGINEYGLVLGKISGIAIALFLLKIKSSLKIDFRKISINRFKMYLYRYREFPLYNMTSSFINVIGLQVLTIFIGIFFSKEDFGYFGLANMIILLPISFISQSIGSIFFQKISENYNNGDYNKLKATFYQTFLMLLCIAIPVFYIIHFFGEDLFVIIYGDNWLMSGKIASILSVVFLSQMIVSPMGVFLIGIKKVKINAFWQYGRSIFMIILMYILLYELELSFLIFIKWYSLGVVLVYAVYLIIMILQLRILRNEIA